MTKKIVYFLGIGGIGMSALACYFSQKGYEIYGYDLTPSDITTKLTEAGAKIHFEEDVEKIPKNVEFVVRTPAVSMEHAEYQYFKEKNIPIYKRAEILGMISRTKSTIAIAGTHGKTTTTAMVTQILRQKAESRRQKAEGRRQKAEDSYQLSEDVLCSLCLVPRPDFLSFIGGISKNFNSNFVHEAGLDAMIVEADEYDRSFLTLYPQVAVITSIDADHLDIYASHERLKESFQLFANQIQSEGSLIIYDEIAHQIDHPNKITYGFSDKAHYQISNLKYEPTRTTFELSVGSYQLSVLVNISGKHNVLNAVAAFAASVAFLKWKEKEKIETYFQNAILLENLADFTGVKRRFDYQIYREDIVYIDDYAHHPQEINSFLSSVRAAFPTQKMTAVFQPHLYSRTRDFADDFAQTLSLADEIILLDVYPAREKPITGITSDWLLSKIEKKEKRKLSKEALIPYLTTHKPEVLTTIGAGDIDRLVPEIVKAFELEIKN